jgi:hypothetical protein
MMRWGVLGLAVAATVSATAPAVACNSKNVLFRDNFTATDPGWALYDKNTVTIGGGSLKLTPQPGTNAFVYYRGDVYDQADVCVDATAVGGGSSLPDGEAGLIFAYEDYVGFYFFWISPKNGTAGVLQWSNSANKFLVPMAAQKIQGLDARVGVKNTLRITIKGAKATLYLNDRQVAQLTITAPKVGGFVGLAAARLDQGPATWTFQKFNISAPP